MSNLSNRALLVAAASVLAAAAASSAHAAAFYLQEQSVRGAGRAFSGEAADTGSASLWWNPAAIGGMTGGDATIGVSEIMPRGNVDDRGTIIVRPGAAPASVGGDAHANNPINDGTLPSGAIAYGFGRFAVGLAVTSPFSFTTNYDADSWTRYTADKTRLRTIDLQPSIAFAITPSLSIGAAANVEHVSASLGNYLPNLAAALPDGQQVLKGSGWDAGWTVGGQFRSGPIAVGISYKSSIKHHLDGSVTTTGLLGPLAGQNTSIDTEADFRTPSQVIGSVRFKATSRLTLNGQVVRFGWDKFDAIRLGDPLNVALPENYRNSWSYAGGVDYAVTPRWTVRAGIQRDETPTRTGQRDARVPDSDRWNFAAGTSVTLGHALTIDAAASYIDFKNATIDRTTAAFAGTAVQTPILVDGELNKAHALVLALGARVAF